MKVLSKLMTKASETHPKGMPELAAVDVKDFQVAYRQASEELFELSYQIQLTGILPEPEVLTRAVLRYKETRYLLDLLDLHIFTMEVPESISAGQQS